MSTVPSMLQPLDRAGQGVTQGGGAPWAAASPIPGAGAGAATGAGVGAPALATPSAEYLRRPPPAAPSSAGRLEAGVAAPSYLGAGASSANPSALPPAPQAATKGLADFGGVVVGPGASTGVAGAWAGAGGGPAPPPAVAGVGRPVIEFPTATATSSPTPSTSYFDVSAGPGEWTPPVSAVPGVNRQGKALPVLPSQATCPV
jgi:hypothetical protein